MPPNPPLDIRTTTSPSRCSSTIVDDDVVDLGDVPRVLAARCVRSSTSCSADKPLRLRQRRSEHRRENDLVRRAERPREVVLKHAAARRGRSRLEHRPHAPAGIARAQAPTASRAPRSGGARNRPAPSRRCATPTVSSRRLMPLNARNPSASVVGARPTCAPTAIAASALRTLCTPSSGDSNRPNSVALTMHVEVRQAVPMLDRRRPPRRLRVEAEGLDRAHGHRRQRMRVWTVGAEQQQAVAAARGSPAGGTPAAPRRDRRRCRRGRTRCC